MVTVYSGANFTGDAKCLKYFKNGTMAGCTPGYYSFLAGILNGLSGILCYKHLIAKKLGGVAKSVRKYCYSRFLIDGNNHS